MKIAFKLLIIIITLLLIFPNYALSQQIAYPYSEVDMGEISEVVASSDIIVYGEVTDLLRDSRYNDTIVIDWYVAKVKVIDTYRGTKYDNVYVMHKRLKPNLTMEKVKEIAGEAYKNRDMKTYYPYSSTLQREREFMDIETGKSYTFLLVNCNLFGDNEPACAPTFSFKPVEGKIWENNFSFKLSLIKAHYTFILLFLFYFVYISWKIRNYLKPKSSL